MPRAHSTGQLRRAERYRGDDLFTKDLLEFLEHRRRHMAETIERWPAAAPAARAATSAKT